MVGDWALRISIAVLVWVVTYYGTGWNRLVQRFPNRRDEKALRREIGAAIINGVATGVSVEVCEHTHRLAIVILWVPIFPRVSIPKSEFVVGEESESILGKFVPISAGDCPIKIQVRKSLVMDLGL